MGDGTKLAVKKADSSAPRWKINQTNCDIPQCGQDGGQDGDNLVADNTVSFWNYPARLVCWQLGGRLPTKNELNCIYTNQSAFGNNFGLGYYWSSAEYNTYSAWAQSFNNGTQYSYGKTEYRSVRCVRGW